MKANQLTIKVSKSNDSSAKSVGVAVASNGTIAREIGMSREQLEALGFEGKVGQTLILPNNKKQLTILVGIGESAKATADVLRTAAAALARASAKVVSLSTNLAVSGRGDRVANAQAVTEGLILATHRYDALKSDKNATSKLESVTLVAPGATNAAVARGSRRGETIADAVCLARDLANMPPAHLTAKMIAERAQKIGAETGVRVEVFNKDQLLAMGCGGIIGVNRGSVNPPRMVKISYRPGGARRGAKKSATKKSTAVKLPHLILVGKGVMYDSGGISLKPSNPDHAMMKADMSGAAAVLATMSTLKSLGCKNQVTAYMMCTDNLPSGSALAMGDVLTMRNGKTVEIHNTDAEGRLILADGLSLAAESKPDAIVDIATLTGACARALGPQMSGVMGNDQKFIDQVVAAAAATDEQTWQLPLERKYRTMIDSYIADMKNVGGTDAGAITAALFLDEFTAGRPWAHIDIAGPMWSDADAGWLQRGATAYGTRLLINLAENFKRR
ncbi:MAG: leucyl aminopeptidase [Actinobacteria bacterium]|nr:leucyl aminopeptidase [Actinomycetota bacterium]